MLNTFEEAKPRDASDVFTDREEPRETFKQFFDRLYAMNVRGGSGNEAPLLHFYGVGGVGKTTLLAQARREFDARHGGGNDFAKIHFASINLQGTPLGSRLPGSDFLWSLRNAFLHNDLRTPLFDCVYVLLWEEDNPGKKIDLPKPRTRAVLDAVLNQLLDLADSSGVAKSVKKFWDQGVLYQQRNKVAKKWGDIPPTEWTQQQRRERLIVLLWMDIVYALETSSHLRVALLVDEFEVIQTTTPNPGSAQTSLALLLANLLSGRSEAVRQRFCVVVMGREILRWDALYDPDWKPLIESHLLGGLSEKDARDFLIGKIAPWYRASGSGKVADAIVRHQDEILRVTNSIEGGIESSHLPFELDLVLDVISTVPDQFSAKLLANEPGRKRALEERFLRYLQGHDEKLLKAMQTLALCQSFDRQLFDHLVSLQVIVGYAPSEFMQLVGDDHSYIGTNTNLPGYYQFHRQMQSSLISSQLTTDEIKAGTAERLKAIIEYFVQRAQFEKPVDFTPEHRQNFTLGFEALQSDATDKLLSAKVISKYAYRLASSFDGLVDPALLASFWSWLSGFCEMAFGPEHRRTLAAISKQANSLHAIGDRDGAKNLRERVLAARKRILGPDHHDTLSAMTNLAISLHALGDQHGARDLREEVLAVWERTLGPEDPGALRAMNNLANSLHAMGDRNGAKTLREKVLAAREHILGPEHRDTLMAMYNLANSLHVMGDFDVARTLREKVLAGRERILGPEHPDTLVAMSSLASSLHSMGDQAGARALKEKVLAVQERLFGPDHPNTLTFMNELASSLHDMGDLADSRTLNEKVLTARERILGPEHPSTLSAMNKLAKSLHVMGDLAGARALWEKVLAGRERILGPEHPDTLTAMNNLAKSLHAMGDLAGARALWGKVLAARNRVLGPEHPKTLELMNLLARGA